MGPTEVALLSATGSLSKWLVLLLVLPLLVRLLGPTRAPPAAVRGGPLIGGAVICSFGFAPSGVALFGMVALQAVAVLALPA
eukprot:6390154-Prymnesium_polylepis.1